MIYYKADTHIGTQENLPNNAVELTAEEYDAELERILASIVTDETETDEELTADEILVEIEGILNDEN